MFWKTAFWKDVIELFSIAEANLYSCLQLDPTDRVLCIVLQKKKFCLCHANTRLSSMVNSNWMETKVHTKTQVILRPVTGHWKLLKRKPPEVWEGILVLNKTMVYLLLDPESQNSRRKFLSVTILQVYHIKLWCFVLYNKYKFQKENELAKL